MIGLDFAGSEMGFAAVENSIFKGWRQLWHSESKRILVKADANPMFEMHIPGKHAAAMELESNGAIQWWSTNGAGGWAQVGTNMMAAVIPGHAAAMNPSDLIAGSSLRPANCAEWGQNRNWALLGTWKCLGFVSDQQDDRWDDRTTLWIRVA